MSVTARQPSFTQAQLHELFDYNPDTGCLLRKVSRRGKARAGMPAGNRMTDGYMRVYLFGNSVLVHRLVWFYVHGEWPTNQVDHINGDRADNRLVNLRVVTHRQNTQNRPEHRTGRLVGCRLKNNRWEARVLLAGTSQYLGMYATEQEAHQAYLRALEGVQ